MFKLTSRDTADGPVLSEYFFEDTGATELVRLGMIHKTSGVLTIEYIPEGK